MPFYIKYLGIEAYGLIGFYLATQSILQLLDLGITPAISREISRQSAVGNIRESGKILHTLAHFYWGIAIAIGVLLATFAPAIAEHWLQGNKLPQESIIRAIQLLGLVIACRWPIGLYTGALLGAERVDVSSGINIVMVVLANGGAVLVLALVSPTIEAFFTWQACVGLAYAILIRRAAWSIIGRIKAPAFNISDLKGMANFAAGMSAIGVTALVLTQIDKVILSKALGLDEFGKYMLASVVVSSLYIVVTPVFNIVYPRFAALVATSSTAQIENLYRFGTRMLASILFPIASILIIFSSDLLNLWIGNDSLTNSIAPIIGLLAIGSVLHGVMHFPYALQLAYGNTRLPLAINLALIALLAPLIYYLVLHFGAVGGAGAWAILHSTYLLLGTWMTHRHLLRGIALRWLFFDVGTPMMISAAIAVTADQILKTVHTTGIWRLVACVVVLVLSVLVSLATSRQFRHLAYHRIFK